MKQFTCLAILTLASSSSGQSYKVPVEIFQAISQDQQHQDREQPKRFHYERMLQAQQSVPHQPIEQQSIQHIQIAQPQQIQYQNQPQHFQYQSQPEHVQYQSQPQHVEYQSQPEHVQYQSAPEHVQIQNQPQNHRIQSQPLQVQRQPQIQSTHISQFGQQSQIGQHNSQSQHNNQLDQQGGINRDAKIMSYERESDGHNYQYAFETDNGIKAQEVGSMDGEGTRTQGAYSYTGDDGQTYTVTYTADENGFHPSGAHLPTPPPMSQEIARSVEQNIRDEANGIVDDGHYHHESDNQQIHQESRHQPTTQGVFQKLQRHNNEHSIQQLQPTQQVQHSVEPQRPIQQVQKHTQRPVKQNIQQYQPVQHQIQQIQPVQQYRHESNGHQLSPDEQFQPIQQNHRPQPHALLQQQVHQQNLLQQQPSQSLFQLPQLHHQDYYQQSSEVSQQFQPVHQKQNSLESLENQPHVEEHRHVEYIIPSILKNFRRRRTDDYVGPAPLPERRSKHPKKP